MARLTKAEAKAHEQAVALIESGGKLSYDDIEFVLANWQESANHVNSAAGAFFTPLGLALDMTIELGNASGRPIRVVDLCAGIGSLSIATWMRHQHAEHKPEIVCVELNPDYVAIGKRLLPEAEWVNASVFDLPELGHFDFAISNPPFGKIDRAGGNAPRYSGAEFEYHVIDIAATLADYGAFILPQMSAGFAYSGQPYFRDDKARKAETFEKQTGMSLQPGCGLDTSIYADEWHGVSPAVEVVCVDLTEALPLYEVAPLLEVTT